MLPREVKRCDPRYADQQGSTHKKGAASQKGKLPPISALGLMMHGQRIEVWAGFQQLKVKEGLIRVLAESCAHRKRLT